MCHKLRNVVAWGRTAIDLHICQKHCFQSHPELTEIR